MTKEEAIKEIDRIQKIAKAISPEYTRLQNILNLLANKLNYCQAIIDGKEAKTSEEVLADAEKEFGSND